MFLSDTTFEASTITLAQELCHVLKQSYKTWCINSHEYSINKLKKEGASDDDFLVQHHKQRKNEILEGIFPEYFTLEEARRYYKVWRMEGNGRSICCFIDKSTGDIYKPAGTKSPAKGIRYNLHRDWEVIKKKADWAGKWLYLR